MCVEERDALVREVLARADEAIRALQVRKGEGSAVIASTECVRSPSTGLHARAGSTRASREERRRTAVEVSLGAHRFRPCEARPPARRGAGASTPQAPARRASRWTASANAAMQRGLQQAGVADDLGDRGVHRSRRDPRAARRHRLEHAAAEALEQRLVDQRVRRIELMSSSSFTRPSASAPSPSTRRARAGARRRRPARLDRRRGVVVRRAEMETSAAVRRRPGREAASRGRRTVVHRTARPRAPRPRHGQRTRRARRRSERFHMQVT